MALPDDAPFERLPDDPPSREQLPHARSGDDGRLPDDGELPLTADDLPDLGDSLELVDRVQHGSRDALDELFGRYQGRLLRIVRAQMSTRLRGLVEPEDILQEAFATAAEKIPSTRFDSHAGILRWLATIVRHRILDKVAYYDRARRDPRREQRLDGAGDTSSELRPFELRAPSMDSPSQELQRREYAQLVDDCVRELEPPAYREAILQRCYFDATWEEVAEATGRETPGAARELYRRALLKLGEKMGPILGDGL